MPFQTASTSSRPAWKKRSLLFPVSSLISTPLDDVTCSTARATTSCVYHTDLRWTCSSLAWTELSVLSTSMILPQAADLKVSVTDICALGSSDPTKEASKEVAQAQGRHKFGPHRGRNGAKVKAKVRVKVPKPDTSGGMFGGT